MKSTGIVRKVDELGRIVIPRELRRILDLNHNDPVEIFVDGEKVVLKKFIPHQECMLTGEVSSDNYFHANGKIILSEEGAEKLVEEIENYLGKHSVSSTK